MSDLKTAGELMYEEITRLEALLTEARNEIADRDGRIEFLLVQHQDFRDIIDKQEAQLAEARWERDEARLDVDRTSTENERLVCKIRHADALAALLRDAQEEAEAVERIYQERHNYILSLESELREADETLCWIPSIIDDGEGRYMICIEITAWRNKTKGAAWRET